MHPTRHLALAARAAVAAALAWLIVRQLGGVADDYPYYAPLGAVVAVTSTVAGSIRETFQGLAAILLGALLAVGVQLLGLPVLVDLALVVALGTLVGRWPKLGHLASWVPIAALFVLIVGRREPLDYAIAYLGLVGLGASVGVAVSLAFPPLGLADLARSAERLREELAGQLDDLADGLSLESPPGSEDWQQRRRAVRSTVHDVGEMVAHAAESRRANWRGRRFDEKADGYYRQARILLDVAHLVEDLTELVAEHERAERHSVAFGPRLRPAAARALGCTAELLRSVEGASGDLDRLRDADTATSELASAIRAERTRSEQDLFAAGSVVTGVRRAMASLTPPHHRDELPSDW